MRCCKHGDGSEDSSRESSKMRQTPLFSAPLTATGGSNKVRDIARDLCPVLPHRYLHLSATSRPLRAARESVSYKSEAGIDIRFCWFGCPCMILD